MQKQLERLNDALSSRFLIVTEIKDIFNVNFGSKKYSIPFIGNNVISLEWYKPYENTIRGFMGSGVIFATLLYVIKQIRANLTVNG